MKRLYRRFALPAALLALAPALAGCELIDKLKARDELNKGVRAYTAQKWQEATKHFSEAIKLDPELTAAQLYLATTYRAQWVPGIPSPENQARAENAIKIFKQVIDNDADKCMPPAAQLEAFRGSERLNACVNAMANIAGLYDGLEQPDLAKEYYRKRLEIEPDNPEPLYGIGTINYKLVSAETGQNGENVENLDEAKKEELAKLVDQGSEALEQALELREKYADAAQYLNLIYRERSYLSKDEEEKKRWLKEADKLALQALELKRRLEEEAERARRTFGGKAVEQN